MKKYYKIGFKNTNYFRDIDASTPMEALELFIEKEGLLNCENIVFK